MMQEKALAESSRRRASINAIVPSSRHLVRTQLPTFQLG
jgi:hypothetical protein